ncbi:hypothetical protein DSECCO2_502920 [anaerobic digester metagenome]
MDRESAKGRSIEYYGPIGQTALTWIPYVVRVGIVELHSGDASRSICDRDALGLCARSSEHQGQSYLQGRPWEVSRTVVVAHRYALPRSGLYIAVECRLRHMSLEVDVYRCSDRHGEEACREHVVVLYRLSAHSEELVR